MKPVLVGTVVVAALAALARRARGDRVPEYDITIGPARIIRRPEYDIDIGPARIITTRENGDDADADVPAPRGPGDGRAESTTVRFVVKVSGLEKLAVSAADVRTAVRDKSGVVPGVSGKPTVVVSDVSGGYAVVARYPNGDGSLTPSRATWAIESVDPRLKGRVSAVRVSHA